MKGADLMEWWLGHLCLSLIRPAGQGGRSIHLSWERQQKTYAVRQWVLEPVAEPEPILAQLLELYWQGLNRPLPFFPETSCAWASAKPGKAEGDARLAWLGNYTLSGEGSDPAYAYFFPPRSLPFTNEFVALTGLFTPMFDSLEETDAAS